MINEALVFLRNRLNDHLKSGRAPTDDPTDLAIFLNGDQLEPIFFPPNFITCMMINIEEETIMRHPDIYRNITIHGEQQNVLPEIRLNIYILFVARFNDYERALYYLSLVIQYFQNHRVFTVHNSPELSEKIGQLIMELTTLPFAEQNEVWNALRTTYHPSVLYKMKMIAFQENTAMAQPEIQGIELRIEQ